jgi:hypothetical protein
LGGIKFLTFLKLGDFRKKTLPIKQEKLDGGKRKLAMTKVIQHLKQNIAKPFLSNYSIKVNLSVKVNQRLFLIERYSLIQAGETL